MRQAIGLLSNLSTEEIQRPLKELGLGLPSVKGKAIQMGVEHRILTMNKYTERGYLAYAHVLRLLTQFGHWPSEALEFKSLRLPTLCTLRLVSSIQGLELENLPPLYKETEISTNLRAASQAIDTTSLECKHAIYWLHGTK